MVESLSIMIACYNERPTLERAVDEALKAAEATGRDHELVIIDDGSTDGSGVLADELSEKHDVVRVVHHERNQGLGGFYRTAFREARCDIVYFMAADLQPIPAEYFGPFLPLFDRGFDGVIGFDLKRDAPALSRLLSLGEKLLFAILFPGVPKIGGPLMLRRRVIRSFDLALALDEADRSWMVLWELMIRAKRAGVPIARWPVRRRPRAQGAIKGSTIRTAVIMLKQIGRLRGALRSD